MGGWVGRQAYTNEFVYIHECTYTYTCETYMHMHMHLHGCMKVYADVSRHVEMHTYVNYSKYAQ